MAPIAQGLGSPLWSSLFEHLATPDRAERMLALTPRGMNWQFADALPLRLAAAAHWMALTGLAPELEDQLPSCGGTPTCTGAELAERVVAALEANPADASAFTQRSVQTNEIGRSGGLILGLAYVACRWNLPMRFVEIGCSAGLNLRFDQFGYWQNGSCVLGNPDSPVRIADVWDVNLPTAPNFEVIERIGVDPHPIDPSDAEVRARLLSYVWPDQLERFSRLQSAIAVAETTPARVESHTRTSEWVDDVFASSEAGVGTLLFHSVMWQYIDGAQQHEMVRVIEEAGARAHTRAPLAWLSFEPDAFDSTRVEIRIREWPSLRGVLLGHADFHATWVRLATI